MNVLEPCERHESILTINFATLAPRRHVILDVDNTLVTPSGSTVDTEIVDFLKQQSAKGDIASLCLVTNNSLPGRKRRQRIARIAEQLDAHFVFAQGWHSKPHPRPFIRAMQLMDATPETTVVIGDQIYTDIRGGNRLGLYTILVTPLGRDHWFTWYRRWKERRLRRA